MKLIKLFITFVFMVLILNFVQSGGSLLTPKMIIRTNISSSDGATIDKAIGVLNDEDYPLNVSLKPSDNIKSMIKLESEGFVLAPGEERWVNFTLDIKEPGEYSGEVIVVLSAEDQQTTGLSSQIIIFAEGNREEVSSGITGAAINDSKDRFSKLPIMNIFLIFALFVVIFMIVFLYKKNIVKGRKEIKTQEKSDRSS
jgi:hypothetical protein